MRKKLGNLLDKEEKYWAQRSRIQWLKEGDRNTQFFHVRATNRKKKNNIARLKDMNGYWRENTTDICKAAREYFQKLFKSNLNSNTVLNLDYIESCISGEVNDRLLKDLTDNEIKEAFSQMDHMKAPGIDGLSGNFFKENWEVVGEDTIKLCQDILRGVKNVDCLNDTIIVIIPKIKEPVDMTNFRPISLYRVVYKIVAKVLTNRLKETLSLCISQNQSAFVLGRMIHDSILVAMS
ncbi:reverse transcriptase [Gossypium australe]|uniref:Reverse transcriptase n=1 Tax=Gossypium australe TaxID=47621 RepID=A0A5B6VPR5_9ROSI|nr:reverse transcriptase [Gossypium australe]